MHLRPQQSSVDQNVAQLRLKTIPEAPTKAYSGKRGRREKEGEREGGEGGEGVREGEEGQERGVGRKGGRGGMVFQLSKDTNMKSDVLNTLTYIHQCICPKQSISMQLDHSQYGVDHVPLRTVQGVSIRANQPKQRQHNLIHHNGVPTAGCL